MRKIVITGGARLKGSVAISGSKNAALPIIPAALCANGACYIDNIPLKKDIFSYIDTIKRLGAACEFVAEHTLRIDGAQILRTAADFESVREIRASYYLLGVLLGRFKAASVLLPGGCDLGARPIDQHLKGFEALGASVRQEHGVVHLSAKRLSGASIYLDMASVGATINIMIAAVFADGVTTIENAAKEPHVVDAANFLNTIGAGVKGAGTDIVRVTGPAELHGGEYMIIPDQIEAGTYMIAAAATGGDVTVTGIIPKHMESLSAKLSEMGCRIESGDDWIRVEAGRALNAVNVKTMTYPGFPTDLQPQMTALLSVASGMSIVTESVFDSRFQYVNELRRLGADVSVDGRSAVIKGRGGMKLSGADVSATDLRGGAALVVAALAAAGKTAIGNVKYIDRGYEDLVGNLKRLGADIERGEGE
jgi:UDP-N-acetylglucosamine 1-carboxyvinyltransferase